MSNMRAKQRARINEAIATLPARHAERVRRRAVMNATALAKLHAPKAQIKEQTHYLSLTAKLAAIRGFKHLTIKNP